MAYFIPSNSMFDKIGSCPVIHNKQQYLIYSEMSALKFEMQLSKAVE